ncbi:MAG: bifunctional oligoribonuclease/PAP phosphatase NrnA [Eubacteriales bacterium]|nr:bifunctional oligoribonuclease/PAP phosphatase NrnA [Eubacteriales bacterium]
MRKIVQWLRSHDDFAVVPHVSPDGDAYGSSIAMALALRGMGKRALVAAPPVPFMYEYLPGQELLVRGEEFPYAPAAVLHVDTASPDRAAAQFANGVATALIDHHESNAGFDDVRWIEPKASSTGEMIVRLLEEMDVQLTGEIAACLYTAISTDTGNFQYSNTTPESMRAAAKLLECGLDVGRINRYLYRLSTLARARLTGEALHGMRLFEEGKIAVAILDKETMERCEATHADTEGISALLGDICGVQVAAMIEQRAENEVKISLRSPDAADVGAVARALGGGGHKYASGATVYAAPEKALELLLEQAREAVG